MQAGEVYVHAHLKRSKMSTSSRDGEMVTVSEVSSEHHKNKTQKGLSEVKVAECLAGLFTSTSSPEVWEQE